jgi:hypothetical protein
MIYRFIATVAFLSVLTSPINVTATAYPSPAQRVFSDRCVETNSQVTSVIQEFTELDKQLWVRESEYLGELVPKVISTLEKIAERNSRTDLRKFCTCAVLALIDEEGPEAMALWDRWATGEISIDEVNSQKASRSLYFSLDREEARYTDLSNCILNIYGDSSPRSPNNELENYESKCSELGFTKGTEKYGDCVMKLYK